MLDVLKNFALKHFEPKQVVDTIVTTRKGSYSFTRNAGKLIPFISDYRNSIYLKRVTVSIEDSIKKMV